MNNSKSKNINEECGLQLNSKGPYNPIPIIVTIPDSEKCVKGKVFIVQAIRNSNILEPSNLIGHIIKSEDYPDRDHQPGISTKNSARDTIMVFSFEKS
jgi:hypothetical protein